MANSVSVNTASVLRVAENGLAANDKTRIVFVSFRNQGTNNHLTIPGANRILGGFLTKLSTGSAQGFIRESDWHSGSANMIRMRGTSTGTTTGLIIYK